jgi:hypothetical protein
MPSLNSEVIEQLIKRYGSSIDLRAQPDVLNSILEEIAVDNITSPRAKFGYMKTYFKDYDRLGYDRTYQQYDKTVDAISLGEYLSLGKDVVAKFDPDVVRQYEDITSNVVRQSRPFENPPK